MKCFFKKACCGCSLKRGTTILGCLNIAGSIITIIVTQSISLNFSSDHYIDSSSYFLSEMIGCFAYIFLIGSIIMILTSILLIIGAKIGNPRLVLPFIIDELVNLVCLIVWFILIIRFLSNDTSSGVVVFVCLVEIFILALYVYFSWIVVSYFVELIRENKMQSSANSTPSVP